MGHGARRPILRGGVPISEQKLYRVLSDSDVTAAGKYLVRFAEWKRPDGARKNIEVIGFEPLMGLGGPWSVIEGDVANLKQRNTVILDKFYSSQLGVERIGDLVEIEGVRARVAGFTRGIRSFTTTPFVFTSFKNALDYTHSPSGQTIFILVRADGRANLQSLKRRIAARVPDLDVYTREEFARRTRNYWLFTTGAGIALLLAALLGLVVGGVIVAQTIYAATVDHQRDYGTLKAIGASNSALCSLILKQALISGVAGYGSGLLMALVVVRFSRAWGALILTPWQLAFAVFALSILMCSAASLISIRKALRVEPASVFKE